MIALVAGATATLKRYAHTGVFGQLIVPGGRNRPNLGVPWACDNGAFSGFDEEKFLAMLERVGPYDGCLWVTAPDVVGDAQATLELFEEWQPRILAAGFPVALVAQDGLIIEQTPWDRITCLFIGGSTEWKLGEDVRALILEAKRRDVLVHVGRVNSVKRLRYFYPLGVDSYDGSGLSIMPDREFALQVSALVHPQMGLEM